MPRQKTADKLGDLQKKRDELSAQIKALEARQKETDRKADTRREVIAGALALEHREKNPDDPFTRKLNALLGEYVTRPADRVLFGLPPLPAAPEPVNLKVQDAAE